MYSIIGHQQEIVDEGGTCDGCSLLPLTPLKKKKKKKKKKKNLIDNNHN